MIALFTVDCVIQRNVPTGSLETTREDDMIKAVHAFARNPRAATETVKGAGALINFRLLVLSSMCRSIQTKEVDDEDIRQILEQVVANIVIFKQYLTGAYEINRLISSLVADHE